MQLSDPVTSIKGIGEKTALAFGKLNIRTVQDLIRTYPRRYLGYETPVSIADAPEMERVTIQGNVDGWFVINYNGRRAYVNSELFS